MWMNHSSKATKKAFPLLGRPFFVVRTGTSSKREEEDRFPSRAPVIAMRAIFPLPPTPLQPFLRHPFFFHPVPEYKKTADNAHLGHHPPPVLLFKRLP
jgi:hypothetical protein